MRDASDRRAPRLLSDRERPYYWDLALALAWASNEVSAKELKNNSAMRRVMLRKECGGEMPLAGNDRAARAELDYLLSNATLRLAVMAGAERGVPARQVEVLGERVVAHRAYRGETTSGASAWQSARFSPGMFASKLVWLANLLPTVSVSRSSLVLTGWARWARQLEFQASITA